MVTTTYIDPYIEHGSKTELVRKVTVSIPLHVLRLVVDERTRRQIGNLRHATISDLLCEAFLHAFTGQPLPTDEELRRTMVTIKKSSMKKPAVRKSTAKKSTTARKPVARKPTTKKPAAKKTLAKKLVKKVATKKVVKKPATKKKATPPVKPVAVIV